MACRKQAWRPAPSARNARCATLCASLPGARPAHAAPPSRARSRKAAALAFSRKAVASLPEGTRRRPALLSAHARCLTLDQGPLGGATSWWRPLARREGGVQRPLWVASAAEGGARWHARRR